jgi:tellurite resistance protein
VRLSTLDFEAFEMATVGTVDCHKADTPRCIAARAKPDAISVDEEPGDFYGLRTRGIDSADVGLTMAKGGGMGQPKARTRQRPRARKLQLDEALIALFIGAMNANDHVSREELARAHHLIWSARRFRRKSGDTVNRLVDRMKTLVEEGEPAAVITTATKAIPRRLRPSAFAVVADLLLADGRIDARERAFLRRLALDLQIDSDVAHDVVEAMLVKNLL